MTDLASAPPSGDAFALHEVVCTAEETRIFDTLLATVRHAGSSASPAICSPASP